MDNSVYKLLYGTTGVPLCTVEDGRISFRILGMDAEFFTDRFAEICLWDFHMQELPSGTPVVHFLNPGFFLGIYQLTETKGLIYGPSVPCRYSWTEIAPWLDSSLYSDNRDAAGRLLMSLNPITEIEYINGFCLAVYLYAGVTIKPEDIYMKQPVYFRKELRPSLASYIVDSRESSGFHTPQSWENQLLDTIEHGNTVMLKHLLHQTIVGRLGVLSFDSARQKRYMFVTSAAVAARAAIRGGMNYETACSLADIYCQHMDSMTDLKHLDELIHQMFFDFCEHVSRIKANDYSYPVQICCDYIQKHTHEKILLKDLAKVSGYSERRLSKKFFDETGIRIVDYIHRVKMEEARFLLQNSSYTVNEIGEYLGYANQSYFIAKFKEVYSKTPSEFRKKAALGADI